MGRASGRAAAEVTRRAFAQVLGEPDFVLDLFMQDPQRSASTSTLSIWFMSRGLAGR